MLSGRGFAYFLYCCKNVLIHVATHHVVRNVDGMRKSQCIGATMALDGNTVQAKQDRTVVFSGVELLAECLEGRAGEDSRHQATE